MARTDPQLNFRIPAELKERLEAAAVENKRTLTAELVTRLESTFTHRVPVERIAFDQGEVSSPKDSVEPSQQAAQMASDVNLLASWQREMTRNSLQDKLYDLLSRRRILSYDRSTYELLAPALRDDIGNPRSRVELEILEKDRAATEREEKKIGRMLARLEQQIHEAGFIIDEGGPDEDQIVLRDRPTLKQHFRDGENAAKHGGVMSGVMNIWRSGSASKKSKE